ncbi:hypothetical protein A3H26_03430 [candidate division WWE3 bacterium RIFCSPLOWO2_12_FULL_36_10]|uniref:Membrane protein 6-pyruvoyl-tetrahydropterin synthase-related domain-containing protein n=1 Tax=candidate division WWE3 bacterium RIFCSPLOWO2_12_FULL_36_10 TaxID=1802630 RepID=A0A1F4VIL0_UNCKA|nr:MAG: hypothetical protein A3H26_03430 [candidate division WWE3 bacterium RIFCSPLOWO2_12_FULL_36_10]
MKRVFAQLKPYIFPIMVSLIFLSFVGYKLFKPGYIIFTDVTESLDIRSTFQKYIYTYSDDMGESLAEKARIPLFYLIYSVYKIFYFNPASFIKVKILVLMALTLFSFIFSLKLLEKHLETDTKKNLWITATTFGALFYITNYWFTNRILHFYLFFSSVTIPINFALFYIYLHSEKRDFRKLIYLIFFLSIFTATPHTVLFEFVIFFTLSIVYIFTSSWSQTKNRILPLIYFFIPLYFLTNLHWILPFAISKSAPDAVWSKTITNLLSKNAEIINSVRLMGYWLVDIKDYFIQNNSVIPYIQIVLTFFPLAILTATIILFRKKVISKLLLVLFLLSTFLCTSGFITNKLYFYLMFDSPVKNFGWLFREYDKFGIILAFVYSICISLLAYKMLGNKILKYLFVAIFTLLIASQLYFLNSQLDKNFRSTIVPEDFFKVNYLLRQDNELYNTAWYPGTPKPTWVDTKEVRFIFSNKVSDKPSITTRSELIYYLDYIFSNTNLEEINVGKALDIVGVKYLVARKDESLFVSEDLVNKLDKQESLEKVFSGNYLVLFKNKEFTGLFKTYKNQIIADMGLNILKSLDFYNIDTKNTLINFTDDFSNLNISKYFILNDPLNYKINKFSNRFVYPANYVSEVENGNADKWRKASLKNLNHAESSFFFNNLGVTNNQFDYDNLVVNARDGWEKVDNGKKPISTMQIKFSDHNNVTIDGKEISYTSKPGDFKYYWDTIRSDRFSTKKIKAIHIKFDSNIDKSLIPHFKVSSYLNDDRVDIKFIYPDENGDVDNIVKIPAEATEADFSMWTLSATGKGYDYKLEGFEVLDISDNVKPLTLSFKTKNYCGSSECVLLARTLNNKRGGDIQFNVDEKYFGVNTKLAEESDVSKESVESVYKWANLGSFRSSKSALSINLLNINGFNSVNAFALLTKNEYEDLINENANDENLSESSGSTTIKAEKVNPAKYKLQIDTDNKPFVLGFSKPFSKNWLANGKESKLINGFINGWELKDSDKNGVTVEYKPEKFFHIGLVISVSTTVLLLFWLIYSFRKDKP